MALPRSGGKHLPFAQLTKAFKGRMVVRIVDGRPYAQAWPGKRGKRGTPAQMKARADFKRMTDVVSQVDDWNKVAARFLAEDTSYTWRDILSRAVTGTLVIAPGMGVMSSSIVLDDISSTPGAMLIRGPDGWIGLEPGADGKLVSMVSGLPAWIDAPHDPLALTQLHGDVSVPAGGGDTLATLAATGVVPGVYTLATVQVDAKGRLLAVADGSVTGGITQLTGDITAGPGSGSQVAALSATGVSAGSYTNTALTVDAKGRVTAASSGSAVGGMNQLTGDVIAGPGTGSQVAALGASGVSAGTYTNATVVVDAKGRVTSAANGSGASAGSGLWASALAGSPSTVALSLTNWLNQGARLVANNVAGITMHDPDTGTTAAPLLKSTVALPAAPYSITACMLVTSKGGTTGGGPSMSLCWTNGTLQHRITLVSGGTPGCFITVARINALGAFVSNDYAASPTSFFPLAWVRLRHDGTNIRFQFSLDGINFIDLFVTTPAAGYLGATGYTNWGLSCGAGGLGDMYGTWTSLTITTP